MREKKPDYDLATPSAAALVESLRSVGYGLETALADLIDNALAAESKKVGLHFFWDGPNSTISIRDDGTGMDAAALVEAMRPGSKSPLDARKATDLGRFGLGLKTASFSQCRRVTVASKRGGGTVAVRCWDLDYVAAAREWRLLRDAPPEAMKEIAVLSGARRGTIVVWSQLDRIIGKSATVGDTRMQSRFLARMADVETHLAMVFHRFLEQRRCALVMNNEEIKPWDPFLSERDGIEPLPARTIGAGDRKVVVQGFVMPHRDRFGSSSELERAGGPGGWVSQQGFYVYRNDRLLVPGGWLDLGFTSDEPHKLARIRVDLPNTVDAAWSIDIKKSRARPPGDERDQMRALAQAARIKARSVYVHRGNYGRGGPTAQAIERPWVAEQRPNGDGTRYRITRNHLLVQQVRESLTDDTAFNALLHLLEETVPIDRIWLDATEQQTTEAKPFAAAPEQLIAVLRDVYRALRSSGSTPQQAKHRMSLMEPFNHYPDAVAALDDC